MIFDLKKRTTELLREIKKFAKNDSLDEFSKFLSRDEEILIGEYICEILRRRGEKIKIPEISAATGISKSYLYQLIPVKKNLPKTVKKNPDRKILLALALELKFSLEETQKLLRRAKVAELYAREKFDAAIIFALERKYSVVRTNILLEELGCELLLF